MNAGVTIVAILLSYLVGSVPTAYLVVKRWANKDVRQLGSGNIGTMNVHRATENKLLTAMVLLGDMLKGVIAVLLARFLLGGHPAGPVLTTAAVILGHNYSIYMGFKGGRGLATAAGALLIFNPLILLLWIVIWIPPFLVSKILVVGTLTATILTPLVTCLLMVARVGDMQRIDVLYSAVISLIVLLRHISKIKKLIEGSEPQKYWKVRGDT